MVAKDNGSETNEFVLHLVAASLVMVKLPWATVPPPRLRAVSN